MNKLISFFETDSGKRVVNMIVCFGASVVIMGALFKLEHWQGADTMLVIGMMTEVFIFALQGFLSPGRDYYWEKVYPGLNEAPDEGEQKAMEASSFTQDFDRMMSENKFEPDVLKRLGDNLKRLGDHIAQINDLTSASAATNEYSDKVKQVTGALTEMKVAYSNATEAANILSDASAETRNYHSQVQQVSKNLAQLNTIYELELQDSNNHLKAMNQFYGSLTSALSNLSESVEDAEKYKHEIAGLASNLSKLNQVYGNMLTAMSMSTQQR